MSGVAEKSSPASESYHSWGDLRRLQGRTAMWAAEVLPIPSEFQVDLNDRLRCALKEAISESMLPFGLEVSADVLSLLADYCELEKPETGWTCWWSKNGAQDYAASAVCFVNCAVDSIDGQTIVAFSPTSDLMIKSWTHTGRGGSYHAPMFQMRGSYDEFVTHHRCLVLDIDSAVSESESNLRWKLMPVRKDARPRNDDDVKRDQRSFSITDKEFNDMPGVPFLVDKTEKDA